MNFCPMISREQIKMLNKIVSHILWNSQQERTARNVSLHIASAEFCPALILFIFEDRPVVGQNFIVYGLAMAGGV